MDKMKMDSMDREVVRGPLVRIHAKIKRHQEAWGQEIKNKRDLYREMEDLYREPEIAALWKQPHLRTG